VEQFHNKLATVSYTSAPIAPVKKIKTVKFYWKAVNRINQATLWHSLPQVAIDKEEFIKLFEIKEVKSTRKMSLFTEKPNELLVLDMNRSNAVNIAIRKLPPLGSLKTTILRMDSKVMNREGVEKLQSLIPTEEEVEKIKEAEDENPDIPLGSAEQFLSMMGSIPGLEARLNLWMFKMDFETTERDICEPLSSLKEGMEILSTNQTFLTIISVTLSLGNILNKTSKPAFELESLTKLSRVKDTDSRKTLLYHIVNKVSEIQPDASNLYSEIEPLINVSRVDFDDLETNLVSMEQQCKKSLGYIKLAAKFDKNTEKLVTIFLSNAAERIMSMKRVLQLVMVKYSGFLDWLGLLKHQHGDYPPTKLATIITDFAMEYKATTTKVNMDKEIERKKSMRKSKKDNAMSSSNPFFGMSPSSKFATTKPKQNEKSEISPKPRHGKDGLEALLAKEAVSLRKKRMHPRRSVGKADSAINFSIVDRDR